MVSMQAKKCDICGALYEQQCTPDVRINIYIHPYGEKWLDLCPKCQKHLENFIGGVECQEYLEKFARTHSSNVPVLEKATPASFTREIWYDGEWCRNMKADMIDGGNEQW